MYHGISVSITYTQMHSQLIYYFPDKNSGGLTDRDESKFKVVLEKRDRGWESLQRKEKKHYKAFHTDTYRNTIA